MLSQNKPRRDAFTFSLGGLTAAGGYTGMPAIADDRLNKPGDQQQAAMASSSHGGVITPQ